MQWIGGGSSVVTAAADRTVARPLYLRLHGGGIYQIFRLQTFQDVTAAALKGRYFADQIRNPFLHEKVYRSRYARSGCD